MTLEVTSVLPEQLWKFYNLDIIEGVREDRIIILFEIFSKNCHSLTASQRHSVATYNSLLRHYFFQFSDLPGVFLFVC